MPMDFNGAVRFVKDVQDTLASLTTEPLGVEVKLTVCRPAKPNAGEKVSWFKVCAEDYDAKIDHKMLRDKLKCYLQAMEAAEEHKK